MWLREGIHISNLQFFIDHITEAKMHVFLFRNWSWRPDINFFHIYFWGFPWPNIFFHVIQKDVQIYNLQIFINHLTEANQICSFACAFNFFLIYWFVGSPRNKHRFLVWFRKGVHISNPQLLLDPRNTNIF